jgi:alpha-galactosidase
MPKIAFIGAGSFGFTRNLVRDVLTFDRLADATICLMDINPERLQFSQQAVQRIVDEGGYPARVEATLDRTEALEGADYVIVTILAGALDVWRHDIEIPKKYGVDINVGDTRGPSGIFRALRTIPVMLDIARDMERFAPRATMLNYTNPMVMLCRAIQRETSIQMTGSLPQRAGHGRDAGEAGSARRWRRSPTPAPASTTWPGIWTTSGRARMPIR